MSLDCVRQQTQQALPAIVLHSSLVSCLLLAGFEHTHAQPTFSHHARCGNNLTSRGESRNDLTTDRGARRRDEMILTCCRVER